MNPYFKFSFSKAGILLFANFVVCGMPSIAIGSTISGYVYAKSSRAGLPDVDVELLNNDYQTRDRTKTDSSGRYTFSGLPDGYYTVKVLPFRYDFEDQQALVEIVTIKAPGAVQVGNGYFTQDFYLLPKHGSLAELETGVVFVQEVPKEAEQLFASAVADLERNQPEEGIRGLRKAVNVFPKYFKALYRLGLELFKKELYGEAAQLFMTAASINDKSATSLYYAGYALHNLGREYNKAAIVALENALGLAPASIQVLYLAGKIERAEGNFEKAEKHLLQAKKLSRIGIPEIHRELAQLYANDLKKFADAADELEQYLKASKLSDEDQKKTKKVISDLRAKAKQSSQKS